MMRALVPLFAIAGMVVIAPMAAADPAPPPFGLCSASSDIEPVDAALREGCYLQECVRYSYLKLALLRRCAGV